MAAEIVLCLKLPQTLVFVQQKQSLLLSYSNHYISNVVLLL